MDNAGETERYIPALTFGWLTPLYDPLIKWIMREETLKNELIRIADVKPDSKVLDLGCGTGTLTIMIQRAQPSAAVTGLDGDGRVLEIARRKASDFNIEWDRGLASQLPYSDARFDRVVTSLVIHHLDTATKRAAFDEAFRVLRPGGALCVLDFCKPRSLPGRLPAMVMRHLEQTADNFDGLLPQFITDAGFSSVHERARFNSPFGPVAILSALKSADETHRPDDPPQ